MFNILLHIRQAFFEKKMKKVAFSFNCVKHPFDDIEAVRGANVPGMLVRG